MRRHSSLPERVNTAQGTPVETAIVGRYHLDLAAIAFVKSRDGILATIMAPPDPERRYDALSSALIVLQTRVERLSDNLVRTSQTSSSLQSVATLFATLYELCRRRSFVRSQLILACCSFASVSETKRGGADERRES
jgi:NADH:ubiquinone oxidoreductase subunit B-like Fe-S oxidoreductase